MTNPLPLPIEEILAHPAFPTVLKFHTPDRQGSASVAEGRAGGPISIGYEVHGTGPIHLVVCRAGPCDSGLCLVVFAIRDFFANNHSG